MGPQERVVVKKNSENVWGEGRNAAKSGEKCNTTTKRRKGGKGWLTGKPPVQKNPLGNEGYKIGRTNQRTTSRGRKGKGNC